MPTSTPGIDCIPSFLPELLPHLDGSPAGRPTNGDDSTVSARFGGVVDTKAGISVSNSPTIPLRAPRPFPAGTELPIRLLMFIAKMLNNIATLDAIGVLRDSIGLVGPVTEACFGPWVDDFVNSIAPLPPGSVQP